MGSIHCVDGGHEFVPCCITRNMNDLFKEHYDDCPICGPSGDVCKPSEQTYTLCDEAMKLVYK